MIRRALLALGFALLACGAYAQGGIQFTPAPAGAMSVTGDCAGSGTGTLALTCTKIFNANPPSFVVKQASISISTTGDNAITLPAQVTKYAITGVWITNCSAIPVLAQVAMYTAAAAGGTNIMAAGVITGATSASVILNQTLAAGIVTTGLTGATLYFRVTVANVAAATCDAYVFGNNLT